MMYKILAKCLVLQIVTSYCQDYQVADIRCEFPDFPEDYRTESLLIRGHLSAKLRKPAGFMGHPLFADARFINPQRDVNCQIKRDPQDPTGLVYFLLIQDITRCGVTKKDGYVNVRVWFPQLSGVVLATDQEVIIMCKPASPTIIENRAAGFAGSLPSIGRVTGVVEESPGRLEYEVVLLKESQGRTDHREDLVDQAVPIGSRLQLRARINTQSAWKYAKLMKVTVSADPNDSHAPNHVILVENGCRKADFKSIVPNQPKRSESDPGEVLLEFQAFMLDTKVEGSSHLWIHATIKACVMDVDCGPESCPDQHDPAGFGRRKRSPLNGGGLSLHVLPKNHYNTTVVSSAPSHFDAKENLVSEKDNSSTFLKNPKTKDFGFLRGEGTSTEVGDNVQVEVIFPEKYFAHTKALHESCTSFLMLSTCLGAALLISVAFLCFLTAKLQKSVKASKTPNFGSIMRDRHNQFAIRDFLDPHYQ